LRGSAGWPQPSAGSASWNASFAFSFYRTTRFVAARAGACSTRSSHTGEGTLTEPWKVAKFGGNCVSTGDMYERIASVVHEDLTRKFLVVSAISGVTDTLVTLLARPREEKEIDSFVADLRRKHMDLLPKSREGKTATFGRGGSDYSAAVVAHALELPTIEIWKDVGGFMSADPKIVPEAFPLSALSYDEAAELSYFGAKALHPRSVQPAQAC